MRRTRGDRAHRLVGRVWVVAMYWTVLSSFFIKQLDPGHFSWIHGLSAFTFLTLTLGTWAPGQRSAVGSDCTATSCAAPTSG
ncbi:MAG: hypothetical protein M3P89_06865 [Actinomycetota bacterium]|nr:hypothetical protein [Actinomycetota bacterium]